jgi:4-carboxymuconolactone decarboxylase
LWDATAGLSTAGIDSTRLVREDGSLVGPFNAAVHAPDTGRALLTLGGTLLEHSEMAREHGIPDEALAAIGSGEDPPFQADDERVVHAVASQLARAGRVDMEACLEARELLGDQGMVELVTLCGYYTLISFLLNAFDVPVPPGAVPRWGEGHPADAASGVGAALSV